MKTWVKIDRATGNVMKRKSASNLERVFHKKYVWIEQTTASVPSYNKETQKLGRIVTQSDLSNLTVDVPSDTKRVEGWEIIDLSVAELKARKENNISKTDYFMARMVEDILVYVAAGTPLTRNGFNAKVWERINDRRTLRGEDKV